MTKRGRTPGTPSMGASIEDSGPDTYRIRWAQGARGAREHKQTTIRGTRAEAEEYRAAVIRDVQVKGYHDPEEHRVQYAPPANLLDGMLAWLEAASSGEDGLRASSKRRYRSHIEALAEAVHAVTRLPETEPLPVTLLARPLFDQIKPELLKRGKSVPARALLVLWQAWGWMGDDPKTWSRVPPRPSLKRGYVPTPRTYGRTEAPSLDHCDACLRRLRAESSKLDTLMIALVMRYTGLRVDQVQSVHLEGLDLRDGMLTVRKGKSKAEQEEMRRVPLSKHLLAEPQWLTFLSAAPATGPIIRPTETSVIRAAWMTATEAGEVPLHTWAPPNRDNARRTHAFRAAFLGHLKDEKVDQDVFKFLVGHAMDMEEKHYGRAFANLCRAAVDDLPPVDWNGPAPLETNVIPLVRRRSPTAGSA